MACRYVDEVGTVHSAIVASGDCFVYPWNPASTTDLMVSITSKDPDVLAALAAARQDEVGMRIHFEETVAFLLPTCPVAKKQASRGKGMAVAEISGATAKGLGSTLKAGKGSTGVELR